MVEYSLKKRIEILERRLSSPLDSIESDYFSNKLTYLKSLENDTLKNINV